MADRNNNGVPDDKERKGRSSGNRKATSFGGPLKPSLGNSPDPLTGLSNWAKGNRGYMGRGETYKPTERFGGLFGNIANTANDITRNLGNFWGSEILGERSRVVAAEAMRWWAPTLSIASVLLRAAAVG